MNYYQRHLGDYMRDTRHLSILEHGVYTLLLDWYYIHERGIPEGMEFRLTSARTKAEKEAVTNVLAEFFSLEDGAWVNHRAEEEISRSVSMRENGKKGGRPTKAEPDENQTLTKTKPKANQTETKTEPNGNQTLTKTKAHHTPVNHKPVNQNPLSSTRCEQPEPVYERALEKPKTEQTETKAEPEAPIFQPSKAAAVCVGCHSLGRRP
jgi:uncharacterized protein YdaU (DUF1376 family)